jgi:hypothetical protein
MLEGWSEDMDKNGNVDMDVDVDAAGNEAGTRGSSRGAYASAVGNNRPAKKWELR